MPKQRSRIGIRVIIALFACAALGVVTYAVVTQGTLTTLDIAAVTWVRAHVSPALIATMRWASLSGGPSIVAVYAAFFVIVCVVRRHLATAAGIAAIVYIGAGLNAALKHLIQRGRPIVEDPLVSLPTYSFPSGHAAASTVFGGVLIMLLARSSHKRFHVAAIGAVVLWIVCVGASRIYLGAHYPTDVLAGLLEGVAWLMLCSLALDHWHVTLKWPSARRAR